MNATATAWGCFQVDWDLGDLILPQQLGQGMKATAGDLEEGVPVRYNVATDFAVLCSNCHRMIHRTSDPSDLAGFRLLVMGTGT